MSHKKDQQRAESGELHRSGSVEKVQMLRCPFPGCTSIFRKPEKGPPCCEWHRKFISDVTFVLSHVQREPVKSTGLVVPNQADVDGAVKALLQQKAAAGARA